jgi:hypothetical protein
MWAGGLAQVGWGNMRKVVGCCDFKNDVLFTKKIDHLKFNVMRQARPVLDQTNKISKV